MAHLRRAARLKHMDDQYIHTMEPVYVTEDDTLVYHGKRMEKGKHYPVRWQGVDYILVSDNNDVNIYEVISDEA